MEAFVFHRATTVSEAASTFGGSPDPRYLAGGQTLLPVMKQGLAMPSDLISLAHVPELTGVTAVSLPGAPAMIVIGAMTPHAVVAADPTIRRRLPALARLAGGIADPAVRNRGTIGGSLANYDPAADYPAAVLGLDATVVTNLRRIAADDFFLGLFTTALEPGELIVRIEFPIPALAGYVKFPHPASRYALVGVMVSQTAGHGEGQSSFSVRVAVTGAGAGVFRVPAMEAALAGRFSPEVLEPIVVDDADFTSDRHASAAYRAHLVGVLARRAVAVALQEPCA